MDQRERRHDSPFRQRITVLLSVRPGATIILIGRGLRFDPANRSLQRVSRFCPGPHENVSRRYPGTIGAVSGFVIISRSCIYPCGGTS